MVIARQDKIIAFIRDLKQENSCIDVNTDLIATGALDSLSVLELVTFLTEEFSATITAADITPVNLRTVGTVTELVKVRTS